MRFHIHLLSEEAEATRGLGLNDPQLCARTNAWDPIMNKLNELFHVTCIVGQGRGRLLVSLFSHC